MDDAVSRAFDRAVDEYLQADGGRTEWDEGYLQAIKDVEQYIDLLGRTAEQMRSHLHRLSYRYIRERNNA